MFSHDDVPFVPGAQIKVVGVGGAGGNAVNTMIQAELDGVEFIVANTDRQALENSLANSRIQLGESLTRGLGAGAKPEIGQQAATESLADVTNLVSGVDMVFVTAGMGGGTGTGAAPVIARAARESGALTVGVVSKPFKFEGRRRMRTATEGLKALRDEVDTIIVVPNERLLAVAGEQMPIVEAFRHVDQVLLSAVKGVSDLINVDGYINVDFADVKSVMTATGLALMGTGEASGEGRAQAAAETAISSPLLEDASISGATGILVNITGGADLALQEMSTAMDLIEEEADDDANIIFGCVVDESFEDKIRVTVIATGFPDQADDVIIGSKQGRKRTVTDNFEAPHRTATKPATQVTSISPAREVAASAQAPAVAAYASNGHSEFATRNASHSHGRDASRAGRTTSATPSVRPGSLFDDNEER